MRNDRPYPCPARGGADMPSRADRSGCQGVSNHRRVSAPVVSRRGAARQAGGMASSGPSASPALRPTRGGRVGGVGPVASFTQHALCCYPTIALRRAAFRPRIGLTQHHPCWLSGNAGFRGGKVLIRARTVLAEGECQWAGKFPAGRFPAGKFPAARCPAQCPQRRPAPAANERTLVFVLNCRRSSPTRHAGRP